jgi:cell division septal protein FtsQ
MAVRKTTKSRGKPHYVKSKKRKGAESSVIAQRTVVVVMSLLLLISLAIGIALGFQWMGRKLFSENPRFEIQHLEITCDGHQYSESKIREYSGISEGMNLFALSFDDIEKDLSLPNVESVYLERVLPSTLIIHVKERVPVARIMIKNSRLPRFLDRYGYVLSPNNDPSLAGLPLVMGLDDELRPGDQVLHQDIDVLLDIIGLCQSKKYLHTYIPLESLDVKYSDFIDMRLTGGTRVRMPRFQLESKLFSLASVLEFAASQGKRVKEIDLTLDSETAPVTYY